MNATELRELDAWLALNVIGLTGTSSMRMLVPDRNYYVHPDGWVRVRDRSATVVRWTPTTDPGAAMLVLEKCAEKLAEDWAVAVEWQPIMGQWRVCQSDKYKGHSAEAATLPLAIAKFAQKLFTKP